MKIMAITPFNFGRSYNSISDMKRANEIREISEQDDLRSMYYEPGLGIDVFPIVEIDKRIPSGQNFEDDFFKKQDEEHLLELVENLPEEQSTILKKRFGLGDLDPQTRKEVAQDMGMTENMVRNRENNALLALRITLTKESKIQERETKA